MNGLKRLMRPEWGVLGALGVCAAAKLTHLDERNLGFVLATGLTPVLYLPAEVLLVVAAVQHRRGLAAAAAALTALHVTWLAGPVLAAHNPVDPARSERLTVFEANLFYANRGDSTIAVHLERVRPDLVILLEASQRSLAPLERSGLLADYPYRSIHQEGNVQNVAVLSRLPLLDPVVHAIDGWPFLQMTVQAGDARVHLLTVHTIAPVSDRRMWQRQLRWVADAVRTAAQPLVVAGDFNATPYHHSLAQIEADGRLQDALARVNTPWPMTWPQARLLPPLLGVDHVLVSNGIRVEKARTVSLQGSDHRGISTTLAVPVT